MGTTVVKKGAGRPAATAKRNRHAQRGPLPARPEQIEDARAVLAVLDVPTGCAGQDTGRSIAKADAFAEKARAAGWEAVTRLDGDRASAIATRGNETIHQAWDLGVYETASATYTIGDRTTLTRNASAARKLLARPRAEAEAEFSRVSSNKAFRRREVAPAKTTRLPFDPILATDLEVIEALRGRRVTWHNRFTQTPEVASIGWTGVEVVEQHGERIVKFLCPRTGFRALRLSALLTVSRGQVERAPVSAPAEKRRVKKGVAA